MNKSTQTLAVVALALAAIAYFVLGGKDAAPSVNPVDTGLQDIHDKVAVDAVDQYEIVKRTGGAVERCTYAGMVVAAYVQAKDDASVVKWRAAQKADCDDAGVPFQ